MKKETINNIATIVGGIVGGAAELTITGILSNLIPGVRKANLLKKLTYIIGISGVSISVGVNVANVVERLILETVDDVESVKEIIKKKVNEAISEEVTNTNISKEYNVEEDDIVENVCIEFGKYYSEAQANSVLDSFTSKPRCGYIVLNLNTNIIYWSTDMNNTSPNIIYWDAQKINNIAHILRLDDGWTVVLPKPINYKTWKLATRLPFKKKGDDA